MRDDAAPSGGALIPELQKYQQQFEAIMEDAHNLVLGLSDDQFNWRAEAGRWSIAECLDHLVKTGDQLLPRIDAGIAAGRSRQLLSQGPFRYGFLGNWIVRSTEPPAKIKVKAPKLLIPVPDQPLAEVVPGFMALQDHLVRRLQEANGIDLARVKVQSPVTRLFRLRLGQTFGLIAAHERRHLWQAHQVKLDPGFPLTVEAA